MAYIIGVSVTYKCLDGYVQLVGQEQLHCQNGSWHGDLLQCRSEFNIIVSAYKGLHVVLTKPQYHDLLYVHKIERLIIYWISPVIKCCWNLKHGEFSLMDLIACIFGPPPLPPMASIPIKFSPLAGIGECRDYGSIPNGERIIEGTSEGSIVLFRCHEDFDLLGNRQLECGSDGYWSAAWPVCRKCENQSFHPPQLL